MRKLNPTQVFNQSINQQEYFLYLPKVIIGSSIDALLYSYWKSIPIIYSNQFRKEPFPFECYEYGDERLEWIYIHRHEFMVDRPYLTIDMNRNEITKQLGNEKRKVYERIMFINSLAGLVPFEDKVCTISIDVEESIIKCSDGYKNYNVKYNQLIIAEEQQIINFDMYFHYNDEKENERALYQVVDWFDVRRGQMHPYRILYGDDDFLKEIYFYPTERERNNSRKPEYLPDEYQKSMHKDAVSLSLLTHQELTMVKGFDGASAALKAAQMFKQVGIRGPSNGFARGERYWLSPRLDHRKREIRKKGIHCYNEIKNITFLNLTDDEILSSIKNDNQFRHYSSYAHKINGDFYGLECYTDNTVK